MTASRPPGSSAGTIRVLASSAIFSTMSRHVTASADMRSIVSPSVSPQATIARYVLRTSRRSNCRESFRAARGVAAKSTTPDTPRSSLCGTPI